MAQPPEDKKPDFSSLPRAAIGMKGLPISRNTRLPSIRSPRDLTLGAMPKKTYMPNIPVRREKKSSSSGNASSPKQENKLEKRQNISPANERGRGRGRGRQIIQTQGAIFSEGIAQNSLSRKEKVREAYQKSDNIVSRGPSIKREKDEEVAGVSKALDNLLRDDFIDDGDDDDVIVIKPIIFPATSELKKVTKTKTEAAEPAADFNPNIAKEMGFDVNQVAKFIKKEKNTDAVEKPEMEVDKPAAPSHKTKLTSDNIEVNDIKNLLNGDVNSPKLMLLQFPELIAKSQRTEELEPSNRQSLNGTDTNVLDNQDASCGTIKSLPEGCIGKMRVMKSGKVKLLIGAVELNLDCSDSFNSKHEVASIRTDSNSGDLAVLGYLEHKLHFVPDENTLLEL